MGGGGVAATIGNAHVVESMKVLHSVLAGNLVNGAADDLYTGSLRHFYSLGYNRIGKLDFSQILVPVRDWLDLSRKHYPKVGDVDGMAIGDVLDVAGTHTHAAILSAGTDAGAKAVLWYPPLDQALDQVPPSAYSIVATRAGYTLASGTDGDFLDQVVARLRTDAWLGSSFWSGFTSQTGVTWVSTAVTWPSDSNNAAWIQFWRALDTQLGTQLGTVALGDAFWSAMPAGTFGNVTILKGHDNLSATRAADDQLGNARPSSANADIGAVED
jgi:hypothetical protein